MEKSKAGFDKTALINELIQGMEYAKELRNQFSSKTTNTCSSSSSSSDDPNSNNNNDYQALNYSLLEKMLSSFDKTIIIATSISPNKLGRQQKGLLFPRSCVSPKSENSQLDSPSPKRRKAMMPKWSKSVQISNGEVISGLEGALEDGFSWRKYGQKDILGARFPRGYYRCTHRNSKGCGATKQVQRSDDDPSIYHILYRGEHTCVHGGHQVEAQFNQAQMKSEPQSFSSPKDQEVYVGLGPEGELKVEPEQQAENQAQLFRSFSFTSAFLEPGSIDNYLLSFTSPAFGSPNNSQSNYFPVSPYQPTPAHFELMVQTSETDNNEAVSGPGSVTNSPIISDFEFPIDETNDIGIYFS